MLVLSSALMTSALVYAQEAPAQQRPAANEQAAPPRSSSAQLSNVRLELTIVDQQGNSPAASKSVTMLVEDRQSGRIRTSRGNTSLNVDGHPEIMRDGKIRVMMSIEYAPQDSPDRPGPAPIQESLWTLLDDGKSQVVSQSADPSTERKVRLEVKATIVR